jgi:hypothetical protein
MPIVVRDADTGDAEGIVVDVGHFVGEQCHSIYAIVRRLPEAKRSK